MPLKFSTTPVLKWRKVKRVDEEGEPHDVEVLCICVRVENTGDTDKTTKVNFRGYIQNKAQPGGPNAELTFCENVQVKVAAHHLEDVCCCDYTRGVIDLVNWEGRIVISSSDIDKDAKTDGKLKIPERRRPKPDGPYERPVKRSRPVPPESRQRFTSVSERRRLSRS